MLLLVKILNQKIGKLEYSIGKYEMLIRATVPIRFFGMDEDDDQSKYYYLLISFDLKSNVIDVIENKLMLFIEKNKDNFVLSHRICC